MVCDLNSSLLFPLGSSRYSGAISLSSAQLMSYKAVFFVLTVVGAMWFTAVGALVFSMNALALGTDRASTVANGSIYMSAFFLALVFNVAILAPGLLLLQPGRLRSVLTRERHSITPRERFRGNAIPPSRGKSFNFQFHFSSIPTEL